MGREERRRRFQEALLNTLYPPSSPSPSPPPNNHHDEQGPAIDVNLLPGLETDDHVETSGPSSPASPASNEEGSGAEKMSRAKRKRLRKRRLKEDASRRGNIIGPLLLPVPGCTAADEQGSRSPGVRPNAPIAIFSYGKPGSGDDHRKKMKRRRMAKRVAKEANENQHQKMNNEN